MKQTPDFAQLIAELRTGPAAAAYLIEAAMERMTAMARRMKRSFVAVGEWEQTEDVLQAAMIRLCRALGEVSVESERHFFRLAALNIRRELIDLARRYSQDSFLHVPQLATSDTQTENAFDPFEVADQTFDPQSLSKWTELHVAIAELPEDEREVTELIWYHEQPQLEIANLLGVDVRTVKRRWRAARLRLYERLYGNGKVIHTDAG